MSGLLRATRRVPLGLDRLETRRLFTIPTVTGDEAFTLDEGASYVLDLADLSASVPDEPAPTLTFNLATVTGGQFELVSAPTVAVNSFTQAQLQASEVRYVHGGGESTAEMITYTVTDGTDSTATRSIAVTVNPVNDAPTQTNLGTLSATEGQSATLTSAILLASDVDNSASQLVYTVSALPMRGALALNGTPLLLGGTFTQADVDAGLVSYTHDGSETTTDGLGLTLGDGSATLPSVMLNISVDPSNDAPIANGATLATDEDVPLTGTLGGSDVDSASLTFSIVDQPADGTVVITDPATGAFTFTPAANFNGTTNFTFQISDGSATSGIATVTINLASVNDAPMASTVPPIQLDEGQTQQLNLSSFFSDVDTANSTPDVLTYSLSGAPAFVTINPSTGVVTIAPGALDSGVYAFSAIATDSSNVAASTTVSLTVNNVVNNPPLLGNLPATVTIAENANVPVFDVDATDPDAGQSLVYSIIGGNESGLFAIDPTTGLITLTSPLNAEAATQYTLTIRVTDNGPPAAESVQGTLTINVTDLNDEPTLVTLNGPTTIGEGSLATYTAIASDADVSAVLSYKWFVDGVEQTGVTGSTFSITYTDEGSHVVRVEVADRDAAAVSSSVTTTVTDVSPTVVLSTPASVNEGASFSLQIGPITDPGMGDVASIGQVAVWWKDGTYTLINETTNADLLAILRAGGSVTVSHVYTDGQNAARQMTVSVFDQIHSYAFDTSVVVNNVAPTGTFAAITPSVPAGSSAFVNWFGQTDVSAEDRTAGLRYTFVLDLNADGLYNSGDVLIAGDGTYSGSTTASIMQIPGTLLSAAGDYKVLGLLIDKDGSPILTRQTTINVTASTLQVVSIGGDHSGFTIVFNREIDTSVLNLWDGTDATNDTPDIVLTRSTGQSIRGSLVLNSTRTGFDFLVTGGILSQGTYTVRMNSGANAFKDLFGSFLDGDYNGTVGGNYVANFGVNAPPGPVLSTPDVSRGPGQPIDIIPGNTNSDLPITMGSGVPVSSINFQMRYDQSLMNVTDIVAGAGLPAGWTVGWTLVTGGVNISLIKSSAGALDIPTGTREIVRVVANVPDSAAIYGKVHVISFASIVVNGNASIEGTADRSVHKVVFLGDANRDGTLNIGDAGLIQSIVLGQVSGFDSYPLIDPTIIVDSSRNNAVDSQDATNAALSGFTGSRPADVPAFTPVTVPVGVGVDPTYRLPTNLPVTAGSTITVPLSVIDDARGVQSSQIRFTYDTVALDLINITAGSLLGSGWQIITNINDAEGWVEVGFYHGSSIAGGSAVTGAVLNFEFMVAANVSDGVFPLTIATPLNMPLSPTIFYDRQGGILATTALSGSLVVDSIAPSVSSSAFNFAGASQSLTITFSEDVSASIAASDFQLLNLTTNTTVSLVVSSISTDGRTVTLTFANTGGLSNSILKDGDYRLRVLANQVQDIAGRTIAADVDSTFYFMNADLNRDRAVNFDDLLLLAQNYGTTSGATFAGGDVTYDGRVDFDDLLALAQRYGTSLVQVATPKRLSARTPRFAETVIS